VAIVDSDPAKIGTRWSDLEIQGPDRLESLLQGLGVELVILAVPARAAQQMAERAVKAGIKGILNFAPIRLKVPGHVPFEDVNLVMQLEALSFAITQRGPSG
jgi:redox-sensing transcriptional repressor